MWEHRAFKNITDGLDYLDSIDDGDGVFNIRQVKHMEARYPMVLYPLYKLQVSFTTSMHRYTSIAHVSICALFRPL